MSNEVTFTATDADYVAANRLWHSRSSRQRWLLWLAIAGFMLAAIYISLRLLGGVSFSGATGEAAPMLVFAAIAFGLRMLTPLTLPRQVRRMMDQNPSLREKMQCRWDDQGIFFSGTNGTADLRWNRLHKWLMDDDTFVFLQTDRMMCVVPRRALDEAQAQSLCSAAVASRLPRA